MNQDWPQKQPIERTERTPFAAPGPIWARPALPDTTPRRRSGGLRLAHALLVIGLLGLTGGILLPWAAPAKYGALPDLIRRGMLLGLLHDGVYIFQVTYLDVAALSLASALLLFLVLLAALNRAMNIPVLTGCAWLLVALLVLSIALGLVFLFARQHLLSALQAGEPVTIGLYLWFGGLGVLVLGLAAEYLAHLRLAGQTGPSGLGRVL